MTYPGFRAQKNSQSAATQASLNVDRYTQDGTSQSRDDAFCMSRNFASMRQRRSAVGTGAGLLGGAVGLIVTLPIVVLSVGIFLMVLTSWRNVPQSTLTILALGAALLVCLGVLLGASWTTQALQPNIRRQAQERRRLNEEWRAVHTARCQQGECPRCASPLPEHDRYFTPTLVEDSPDDDD